MQSTGIDLHYQYDVTIKNIRIRGFDVCIHIGNSFGTIVTGNDITDNGYGIDIFMCLTNKVIGNNITNNSNGGIRISFASGNEISSNYIAKNEPRGILIGYSSNEVISSNSVKNNGYGVFIDRSTHIMLKNNSMVDNGQNFGVEGWFSNDFFNDVDASNTVGGKPIYYWINRRNMEIPSDAGYVDLVNCTNITVQNLNLSRNGQGILLASTTNSTITKNIITNTYDGLCLHLSSKQNIIENHLTNNTVGIYFHESSNNTVSANKITDNGYGIKFDYSNTGNDIDRNLIENNTWCGIHFFESSGNIFSHNHFNNSKQVTDESLGWLVKYSINIWDNGTVGNYWSDYKSIDANADGIGDTPYKIDTNNQDRYPLMKPIAIPEFPNMLISITLFMVMAVVFVFSRLKIKRKSAEQ